MKLPSNSPITMPFGSTLDPYSADSPHMGTDFAYTPDNTIYAPFSGKVILVENNGRDGNGIYMYNGDQFHGLLHTSKYLVNNGDSVTQGQPIGIMGATGFAQGVHLHWCVKVNDQFIDPMSLIEEKDDMKIATAAEVNLLWQLNGINRAPTEDEVQEALGRNLDEYVSYLLSTDPFKANLAKVKYYDKDLDTLNAINKLIKGE